MEFIIIFILGIIYLLLTSGPTSTTVSKPKHKPRQSHTSAKPISQPEPTYTLPPRHAGNMYMSAKDKQAYLKSPEWQTKRQLVFTRDNHQCQKCSSTTNLQCHHITYANLGDEPLTHLITLCGGCHQKLHDLLGYDRTTIYPLSGLKNLP